MSRQYYYSFYFYLGLMGNLSTLPFADASIGFRGCESFLSDLLLYLFGLGLLSSFEKYYSLYLLGKTH